MSRKVLLPLVVLLSPLLSSCYTLTQGYHQVGLLFERKPLQEVLAEGKETPQRLEKLVWVPRILEFGRDRVGLTTGKSYTKYISLRGDSVTYVVQAAPKRELKLHTWWFPIVGSQPYLGYFEKTDALAKRDALIKEGFDTTVGGVQAFSLLGFFPDPLYSSMLDGNSLPELVELLLHECLHLTVYIPNFSQLNENLADFVAKKATAVFLREHPDVGNAETYQKKYERTLAAQARFKVFLVGAKERLQKFYSQSLLDPALREEEAFLKERQKIFDALSEDYLIHMEGLQEGTSYAYAFRKGRINNAVVLGYSLYEAKQAPFEEAFATAGNDIAKFVQNIKSCLEKKSFDSEQELWASVEKCGKGTHE
jgi:predicted aminopeptidase